MLQRGVEDDPAHIVEVDVNAVRASRAKRFHHLLGSVVDCRVETELVDDVPAFHCSTGQADHTAVAHLGQLADDRTHGTGGGGDHHRLARLRLANLEQTDIGGYPGHPHHPECRRQRHQARVEDAELLAGRYAVTAPADRPAYVLTHKLPLFERR